MLSKIILAKINIFTLMESCVLSNRFCIYILISYIFHFICQVYWMRRITAPMCITLTREIQTWMGWETCVTIVLSSIIPIRCVDTAIRCFLPPHPTTIIRIHHPAFFYSSAYICLSIETEFQRLVLNVCLSFITPCKGGVNPACSSRAHQFNKA